jgi:hypothetical protein
MGLGQLATSQLLSRRYSNVKFFGKFMEEYQPTAASIPCPTRQFDSGFREELGQVKMDNLASKFLAQW